MQYTLKVEDHLSDHTFNRLPKAFPNSNQDSLKMVKKHIQSLSGFQPVCYSCCINSCVCFIRAYEDLNKCPNCKEAQLKVNGKPRKYFDYIPIIPQLQAMLANSLHAKKMCYRANHVHEPGTIKDIFGGSHYQTLLNTLSPPVRPTPFSTSPMDATLPLAF